MGREWKEVSFNDLGEVNRGRSRHRPRYAEHLYGGPYPFIQTGDIRGSGGRIFKHTQTYSEAGLAQSRLWPTGTMCITIAANIAETAILTYPACFPDSVVGFVADENKCDVQFIEYNFRFLKRRLQSEAIGSVQDNINLGTLSRLNIPLPPLPEQKAIAHILGSLDDKIELNRSMNATLEGMAQAFFKSWFVDFDPVLDNAIRAGNPIPDELAERAEVRRSILEQNQNDELGILNAEIKKSSLHNSKFITHHSSFPSAFQITEEMGWIPEGWDLATLGDYLEIKRGGSPRPIHDFLRSEGLPWVKIADATASISRFLFATKDFIKPEGLRKTVLMKKGALILSNSATPGLPIFLELDACIHDGWLHFPKKRHFSDLYLYQLFLVIREELVNQGNGSVFTNLKTDILRAQRVVVPPSPLLESFDGLMTPIFEKILALNVKTRLLTKLCDTLLPKLISGELRIPNAEKFAEEALS